eukprot:Colp12_sorted_trinity150504_noHs@31757
MASEEQQPSGARVVKDTVSGTFAGIAQVLTGQPFDTIKVRLQTQSTTNPLYSGVVDCFKKTVSQEGPLALYKGTMAPLVGIGACVSIQFGVLESSKRYFKKKTQDGILTYPQLFISGGLAGIANSFVASPVENIRIRMQIQGKGQQEYSSSFDCLKKVYRQYGITGVYKGLLATVVREAGGAASYYTVYALLVRQLTGSPTKSAADLATWQVLMCGGLAGIMFWTPMFPADVIKSKMQADSFANPKYTGYMQCIRSTVAEEGLAGLYRGFSPCMMRAIPANAATFLAFETAMNFLGRD